MDQTPDPPAVAHNTTASTTTTKAAPSASEGLRARQLDRLATRSKPARLPLSVKTKTQERAFTSSIVSTTPDSDLLNDTATLRKPSLASKKSTGLHRDATVNSTRAQQRLNNKTLEHGENTTMHGRASGSNGENKLMDETLSSGKEGRSFTVGKVGGGGKIYLRPSIRPAHQLYQQPNFQFPPRPTTTANPALLPGKVEEHDNRDSAWSYQSRTTPLCDQPPSLRPSQHGRAHSHSTIDEQAVQDWDVGAFKVVIERPSRDGRPKTAHGASGALPALEVPIPSYKIGTPRFSVRGTPFIRGSSYAPTEADSRMSFASASNRESSFAQGNRDSRTFHPVPVGARHSIASSHPADTGSLYELRLPPAGLSRTNPNLMTRQAIVPEMFDAISRPPMSEDRSVVRRNLAGQISAATPARLIVEVTQELNYELVASVFITYRSYIAASDLLSLVMARLQHGIDQGDSGLVVTVRCFTVIRHWLVNFFIDDYVLDYELRVQFCHLVNDMVDKHAVMMTNSKTTNDILSNIKRLWRDSCSTYWDGPEFDVDLGALVPISPGGVAGSRDPNLTPKAFDEMFLSAAPKLGVNNLSRLSKAPILELDLDDSVASSTRRFFASAPPDKGDDDDRGDQRISSQPSRHKSHPSQQDRPLSPKSINSIEAFSCSIPLRSAHLVTSSGVGAHPVATSPTVSATPTSRAPKPLRSNSQRGPRRNRSLSNSSRPDRPWSRDAGPYPNATEGELYITDRFAGSLIRGLAFLPPLQIFLPDERSVSRPASLSNKNEAPSKHEANHSGGGMKRMFGNVRRAVSKSEGGESPKVPTFPHLSMALEQTVAVGCAAGAAAVKHCFRAPTTGMAMRPDKLSQFVEREFEAVVEEHKAEAARMEKRAESSEAPPEAKVERESVRQSGEAPSQSVPPPRHTKSRSSERERYMRMADELENSHFSQARINESELIAAPVAGTSWKLSAAPTPPVTPPERIQAQTKRSSDLLGDYGASTAERTPSLVLGLRSPASDLESQPSFRPLQHPSMRPFNRDMKARQSSSLRRLASFHSGYTRQMTERSFDATTFSDSIRRASIGSTHAPGNRMLRRRPGGDLRAVNNVGDLPLRRYRSDDSLSTYSASLRTSFKLGSKEPAAPSNIETFSVDDSRPFSVGAIADPDGTTKPRISLYSTDSKPVMRPSFQAEAAKLAEIPDDTDDDGGVEAALAKLEGKYDQRKSQLSTQSFSEDVTKGSEIRLERVLDRTASVFGPNPIDAGKRAHGDNRELEFLSEPLAKADGTLPTPTGGRSSPESDYTDNDIPLLQRDSDYPAYQMPSQRVMQTDGHSESKLQERAWQHISLPTQESMGVIDKTDSLNSIALGERLPRHFSARESYEEIGDRNRDSDLSSEISMDGFLHPEDVRVKDRGLTMNQALDLLPARGTFPPTPQGTPILSGPRQSPAMRSWYEKKPETITRGGPIDDALASGGALIIDEHLSFILSFPASLLAQQFTLIEIEALSEIHFRELLEMKWSHDPASSCRSWPKFLQKLSKVEEDDTVSHGIEICAARSSIMTSWAISQVVLTTNIMERVLTVSKLIHVANECRILGNYATLFQLTVALTNPLLTELHQTWEKVAPADVALLRQFEALIQPANNFRRLRDEMESVLGKGTCIPLVAIYAKDLSALKDMPSYIASTLSEPPLINVAKCKAQASVVQLVARFLEKSGELRIEPVSGVVERCLWVGGLRDDEVKGCARALV